MRGDPACPGAYLLGHLTEQQLRVTHLAVGLLQFQTQLRDHVPAVLQLRLPGETGQQVTHCLRPGPHPTWPSVPGQVGEPSFAAAPLFLGHQDLVS